MLVKVLLADDISAVRKLERRLLESESEIEVVGEAADAPEAVRLTGELKPDVIVMDLHMPGDGYTVTRDVKAQRPQVKVLAVTAESELYGPYALGELGVDDLLTRTDIGRRLIPAIKRLARIA